ncbi:MAG TPA: SCO family protein [Steroidobacter sp.]|jgi:protein SCO1/2|nr:SCO family protein [Steroidobacter sp.]
MVHRFSLLLGLLSLCALGAHASAPALDQQAALRASQAVINAAPGDYTLLDRQGRPIRLSSYRGKPLLVNFIYTGCFHVCPTSTVALHNAIASMRDRFGPTQFNIISIGFNQPTDTPTALQAFAAQQRINDPNWEFLSPRAEDVPALARDFGFSYVATPAGFDHTLQVTIVDAQGRIRRQVYGDRFNAAALGEPLKQLLTGAFIEHGATLADILDRVRILCSVYDPETGKYRVDYTLPLEIAGGVTFAAVMLWFALTEWRMRRLLRRRSSE